MNTQTKQVATISEYWKKELNDIVKSPNGSYLKKTLGIYKLDSITNEIALHRITQAFTVVAPKIKTEQDYIECKMTLYGTLQKMTKLGIDLNDTEYWHLTPYGTEINADYQYQALLRAFAKSGMLALPRFEYILKDEEFATEDENGKIIVRYLDKGLPKTISLSDLSSDKYRIFFCLLNIIDGKTKKLLHQIKVQMSVEEILKRKQSSKTKDSGETIKYTDKQTGQKNEYKKKKNQFGKNGQKNKLTKLF